MKPECVVCNTPLDPKTAVRVGRWPLCPEHAELAAHAARKMNEALTDLGLSPESQQNVLDAYEGLKLTSKSLGPLAKGLLKALKAPVKEKS